ncbi:MAG: class I SAM-dependent methyltransferase [Planctomycetes bacterium]|nr:class I SAM-dependent methyltransferase [Planctomycetota bacterium]
MSENGADENATSECKASAAPTSAGSCPRCFQGLGERSCGACGLAFEREGRLIDVLGRDPRESDAARVERFYERSPFPGYAPDDDGGTLLDRARRSSFLRALDAALPAQARVLDCGCGTAQLAAFLALAAPRRRVFGLDGCRESLRCAEGFRARVGLENLQLARADLFAMPVRAGSFEVVLSRGVVHHTADPVRAIECVAQCVAPGGVLVLGFYESAARLFHAARRALARPLSTPLRALDPVLRRADLAPEKRRIWIEDQYHHPLERMLAMPAVLAQLERLGFSWLRSVPPGIESGLFEATPRPGPLARARLRLGWCLRGVNDPDAGLVLLLARRGSR